MGHTAIATTIAGRKLEINEFILSSYGTDQDGESYKQYAMADAGWKWLTTNEKRFVLRVEKPERTTPAFGITKSILGVMSGDDVPF